MPIVNQTYIAKKLKISRATVSKALSNADDISEGIKKRVRDLAEKDNYIPHYHARNLQSQKTNTIGEKEYIDLAIYASRRNFGGCFQRNIIEKKFFLLLTRVS